MSLLSTFHWLDLFYASLTAISTVFLVILIRVFGNLSVTSSTFGPDLNLLTYGFLWETTINAVRGHSYWIRFDPATWPINKAATLLIIAVLNLILLAWNMKLAEKLEGLYKQNKRNFIAEWLLRPLIIAVGCTSLIAFLFINSVWS